MTQSDAVDAAQKRADKTGKRMVVYQIVGSGRSWNEYHVTADRDDLPNEWVVLAFIDPK